MVPLAKRSKSRSPGESFVCPQCKAESFNPNDIREGYCGRCHEFTRLQARVDDLERELEHVRGDIDGWREIAHAWRDRADAAHRVRQQEHAQAALGYHQVTEEMRQRMMLQSQAQQQLAQQNQSLGQQALQNQFYGQELGQLGVFGNQQIPYCNCVPGRGGFLRGDN